MWKTKDTAMKEYYLALGGYTVWRVVFNEGSRWWGMLTDEQKAIALAGIIYKGTRYGILYREGGSKIHPSGGLRDNGFFMKSDVFYAIPEFMIREAEVEKSFASDNFIVMPESFKDDLLKATRYANGDMNIPDVTMTRYGLKLCSNKKKLSYFGVGDGYRRPYSISNATHTLHTYERYLSTPKPSQATHKLYKYSKAVPIPGVNPELERVRAFIAVLRQEGRQDVRNNWLMFQAE